MKTPDPGLPADAPDGCAPAARSTLDWAVQAGLADEVLRELALRRRRRRTVLLSTVAALAVAAVVVWQGAFAGGGTPAASTALVVRPRTLGLPDGSVAELKSDAAIKLEFSEAVRRVVLVRGEAHFTVTKNPARPFVVAAGRLEVRAVGTAFAVQLDGSAVEVVVTEGRVTVKPAAVPLASGRAPAESPTLVEAGQRVLVSAAQMNADVPSGGWPVDRLSLARLAETQAWRVPRLEFSGTPLAEALPLFNQHSPVRLVLEDAEMGRLRLSGIVRADNVETLLRLLESNFGITAERVDTAEIRLKRAR